MRPNAIVAPALVHVSQIVALDDLIFMWKSEKLHIDSLS